MGAVSKCKIQVSLPQRFLINAIVVSTIDKISILKQVLKNKFSIVLNTIENAITRLELLT